MTIAVLLTRYSWRPIRNCPGRYTLVRKDLKSFNVFYSSLKDITTHTSSAVVDPVLVYPMEDGGLITYRHADGFLVHTLNNQSGFERKMRDLGLSGK